ncbi:hypothetical protein VPNG_00790 [Cytospora leucostoma]|uniref:Uncharacterized protein n=1 Tax=Cytospora leucostoma TaxID=1230097 RepID=A0A423XM69_9PEZI|nr:hypothetical protein VPNG_00790 [Cytospora leucostoma]
MSRPSSFVAEEPAQRPRSRLGGGRPPPSRHVRFIGPPQTSSTESDYLSGRTSEPSEFLGRHTRYHDNVIGGDGVVEETVDADWPMLVMTLQDQLKRALVIGGTGHLGGAVLDLLQREHQDVPLRALIRSDDKASRLRSRYPKVAAVIGDLGSLAVLEEESRSADIVVNCAPDITHDSGIGAVLGGLGGGGQREQGSRRGFYIHTSGAATFYDEPEGVRGERVHDDVADMDEILGTDPSRTHVATDNLVRSAHPAVNVAIVSPPGIGGISPSAEHPAPLVTGVLHSTAGAFGSGFQIARGENLSGWVHVLDLARAFGLLVDDALGALQRGGAAAAAPAGPAGSPLWGPRAYYFASGEEVAFRDLQGAIVPVLHGHGVIPSREVRSVTHAEAARTCLAGGTDYDPDAPLPPPDSWVNHLATWFGVNMRIRPSRLLALGWKPEKSTLEAWEEAFELYLGRLKE